MSNERTEISSLGEFGLIEHQTVETVVAKITDTLKIAKEMRPGQRNNLDALCRHFGVNNSKRTLHGALLDAELLAEVYMAMTRGQDSLMMELEAPLKKSNESVRFEAEPLRVKMANEIETEAHQLYLASLEKSGDCLWSHLEQTKN